MLCLFPLPSLRERREDISVLAEYFVEKHCNTYAQPVRKIVPETLARLQKLSLARECARVRKRLNPRSYFGRRGGYTTRSST